MPIKGLEDNAIKTSVETLNACLSDVIVLRLALKQAHWNMKGKSFIGIHELFDTVAARVAETEDTMAERIQVLDGQAVGTAEAIVKSSRLAPYPTDLVDEMKHVKEISIRFADVGASLREAIDTVSESGDEGTADLFTAASRQFDKDLWFIESHLGK
ncbi:DNA starvation/stationary phase protection protein Dps [Phaeovulum sp. W22_SRMD_FR3]|uniref:DNA starvation/stationary phase protection protein Dps n=1 Tax=Phaeovulum sp. W22_SRMD_FR3 TaxID=3240274 RepID=UPI003F9CB37B